MKNCHCFNRNAFSFCPPKNFLNVFCHTKIKENIWGQFHKGRLVPTVRCCEPDLGILRRKSHDILVKRKYTRSPTLPPRYDTVLTAAVNHTGMVRRNLRERNLWMKEDGNSVTRAQCVKAVTVYRQLYFLNV